MKTTTIYTKHIVSIEIIPEQKSQCFTYLKEKKFLGITIRREGIYIKELSGCFEDTKENFLKRNHAYIDEDGNLISRTFVVIRTADQMKYVYRLSDHVSAIMYINWLKGHETIGGPKTKEAINYNEQTRSWENL